MKKILLPLLFLSSTILISAQQTENIQVIDVATFKEAVVGKTVQLVDVRTSEEYNAGYIDNAINIDYFDQEKFKKEFKKLDKDKPVYVYCRSGSRSNMSAIILKDLGFTKLYDLDGGYIAWCNL